MKLIAKIVPAEHRSSLIVVPHTPHPSTPVVVRTPKSTPIVVRKENV